ncbi:unnamed protein product [Ilex paraguariensis]|uniref:Protein RIK n=1 Tax=Ilex paraguariensis TaxID=185542 RepID=A0ABC8T4I7_9AQUA
MLKAFSDISIRLGELVCCCCWLVLYMQDQYVNHIVNETGAIVSLRGRGSGNAENVQGEGGQQPLHLFLSSNNPKSLERAKLLAENLLHTICAECGASRVSSSNIYGAVPPPQQVLAGILSSGTEFKANIIPVTGLTSSNGGSVPVPADSPVTVSGPPPVFSQGAVPHLQSQSNVVCYPQPFLTGGTSYSGYGGIYPQVTPLQQVALALRQSTSTATSTVAPSTAEAVTASNSSRSSSEKNKPPPQKRKFQELPVASKEPAKPHQKSLQGSKFLKPCVLTSDLDVRNISTMPAPKKLVQSSSDGMPPPPPRTMPLPPARTMPPPPPKFNSSMPDLKALKDNSMDKLNAETLPDTLVKLMEYGDEDEDLEETTEEPFKDNSDALPVQKPFWAV